MSCPCGNPGSIACISGRCGLHCRLVHCSRHRLFGGATLESNENMLFHDRYILYEENSKRTCLSNEEIVEFNSICKFKNSIQQVKVVEDVVRLARKKKLDEKQLIPIKANQTRKRNNLYTDYKSEYRDILHLMEKDIRTRILNNENSLFSDILKDKDNIPTMKKMEEWVSKKNVIKRKDKFCQDILANIGSFVKTDDILLLMDAFRIENHLFQPFVNAYKKCGFKKIGIETFRDYLAIKPDKKIAQITVFSDYHLTRKDIESVKCSEVNNPHYRCASMMKLFNEREIMVVCANKITSQTDRHSLSFRST